MPPLHHIAIIGANGNLGPYVLKALLNEPSFRVTVLSRASSKSTYPADIPHIHIPDDFAHAALVNILRPFDAIVCTFFGTERENSIKLANAAFDAGVRHFIPADYGSCDSSDPRSLALIPLYQNKKDVRDHLVALSERARADGSRLSWTSLITGHFFDYGLRSGLLAIDVPARRARIYDGGNVRFAASGLRSIGRAVVAVLKHAEESRVRNRLVYVRECAMTQNELIACVEKVSGHRYEIERVDSQRYILEKKRELEGVAAERKKEVNEELVSAEGIVNTDWDKKGGAFVNDVLGLKESRLEDMVREELNSTVVLTN